jgi:hypothetical protein
VNVEDRLSETFPEVTVSENRVYGNRRKVIFWTEVDDE